ncbi:MAG: capsular polysaccharide biosynthesis protein [Granulosicoccus sp.]|nr:capsular polysaccharide biosynthesis protein [Granulosicoccus sp.]
MTRATNLSGDPQVAVALSPGIRAIEHLPEFLGVRHVLSPREARRQALPVDVVLVWGRKDNCKAAIEYAERRALPLWYLEDGWIRTSSDETHSRRCYSITIDRAGVYYDSTQTSELEQYLNQSEELFSNSCGPEALKYALACRRRLVDNQITKYNYCSARLPEWQASAVPYVLVVDQTLDDASVRFGAMDEQDFLHMLDCAIDENPQTSVIVRTHPDVVCGRRKGYLADYAATRGVKVVAGTDNPIAWVKQADRVYVGTSQLGYEALLCERAVSVFGLPFYAGWGLSDDRQSIGRRIRKRSIDQLFHATHVRFARYCSPMSGRRWQLHETLDHVCLQQQNFRRNARRFHCVGITPWKRGYIRQFLRSPDGTVVFGDEHDVKDADTLVTWGFRRYCEGEHAGLKPPVTRSGTDTVPSIAADNTALPLWRLEDGFLRSAGLGSDYTAPGSLVVDGQGLYFDPDAASDLETLLNDHNCSEHELHQARELRRLIIAAGVSKYDVVTPGQTIHESADKLCVLVTGQVEDDESIKRGCSDITTNAALLRAVRKARPDAWIVYRPHPDVQTGNRRGKVDPFTEQSCADVVDTDSSIIECMEACDELHTMTSLSGFEALLREKQVVTYGAPFYAGWGLTQDYRRIERRSRCRTLDELVFMVLVMYPRYVDIVTGEFVTAEQMVRAIQRQKQQAVKNYDSWSGKQMNKVVNIVKGLRYAP